MIVPARYRSLRRSFDGGMSTARLYHDIHLERDVIIKELQTGADQKRLFDEIRALSTIRSRHVVEIYDIIKDFSGRITAIVEEFIPGDDLLAKAGKVDAAEALRLGAALSAGLADIHNHGQIHRDIKLNNLKIDRDGYLKIFDFGLARSDHNAATIGLVGTFGYIAPELCVADGIITEFTQAVDTFAFASAMLRLIRGKFPDDLKKVPPLLPCAEANFHVQTVKLPDEICDLLNQCHATNAGDRPSMVEISKSFKRHIVEGQHRATLVVGANVYALDSNNRSVTITAGNVDRCTVKYDGKLFSITASSGDVYVNNASFAVPKNLEGSCLITLGPPSAGFNRVHVPVDVSYPEAMI